MQTINTVLWLFIVSWQIAAVQVAHEPIISSLVKHKININEHQKVSEGFNRRKMSSLM